MYYETSSEDGPFQDSEPFLKSEGWTEDAPTTSENRSCRSKLWAIIFHTTIALIYFILISSTVIWKSNKIPLPHQEPAPEHQDVEEIYLPAEEAIQWEYTDFPLRDFYHDNPYVGDPRPVHDEAWRRLLQNMNVRFTPEEMHKINLTSLALKDGSGYVGSFTSYHEIHCVHWVRKWIHREHYWPYLEGKALKERKVHIEHCLENLRLNAMCRGSRVVSTFEWFGSLPRPALEQQHKCINWEKFDAWNAERRVDLFDLDSLANRPEPPLMEEPDVDVRLGTKKPESE